VNLTFLSPASDHHYKFNLRLLTAFICGACMQFSFAPLQWSWLGVIAIAIWASLLCRALSRQQALWLGLSFGFGWFSVGAWWLSVTVHDYGGLPWFVAALCVVLTGSVLSLFAGLWGWLSHLLARSNPWSWFFAFPAMAILSEWLRGHLFSGLPWTALGNLTLDSPWSAWASVLGVYGTGLFPALAAFSLAALFHRPFLLPGLTGLFLLLLSSVFPPAISDLSNTATYRAALIQASIPQDQKWDAAFLQETMLRYTRLSNQATEADIIIWPESAVPFFLELAPDWSNWLDNNVRQWNKPLFFGGMKLGEAISSGDAQQQAENGLFLFEPVQNSTIIQKSFAGKHHLVPFGEYVPSWIPWLHTLVPAIASFQPSNDDGGVIWQGQHFGALICYESIFPEEARHRVLHGAQVLAIVTNDAWYNKTPAAWQHLQASRMRAIETGRFVLRAANSGVSAIIDPAGDIQVTAPWWTQRVIQGDYHLSDHITPYVRRGDMPSLAAALFMLMIGRWIRRRDTSSYAG